MHRVHVTGELSESPTEQRGSDVCSPDTNRGGGGEGGAAGGGAPRSPSHRVAPLDTSYRRSSSGYYSIDSLPASPRPVASTQTPSLPAQAVLHAQARLAEEELDSPFVGSSAGPPPTRLRDLAGAMQTVEFGQQLRRIGDDYNDYILRRRAHQAPGVLDLLPELHNFHQDPGFLFCVGFVCFVIAWYWGGDRADPRQR
ncbi:bcl-2-like protein 11 [Corythoichthys intestinalis]|uniref:bcl-2-like protein 11 n=1 Tax=Corythoichthys intestinalis TaxID=161448 RepID=UPI0025A51868|nr:bcl-2-like protein 11 [Corythoichthys intestinalis]